MSSNPSLGSALGAIGRPPAAKRPFAMTTLQRSTENVSFVPNLTAVRYERNCGNAAAALRR